MPFTPDSGYYNRYSKSKNFFEWRNIAGEVPQSAELNEIQSLAKDLVQRTGDSFLQNGDVVSGMFLTRLGEDSKTFDSESLPVVTYNTEGSGKIWIDGVVHEVSEKVTGLAVPKSKNDVPLWGFLGVYLRKEVVQSASDASLYDPAISDINGTALGLPGANRLKVTPIWVAGTLSVSDFDDKKINNLGGITNDPNTAASLVFNIDTTESISSDCVYNAKVTLPPAVTGATLLKIFSKESKTITPGSKIKFSVKVVNPGNGNTISVRPQLFISSSSLVPNNSNPSTSLTAGTASNISLEITPDILTSLGVGSSTPLNIGLEITSNSSISTGIEIYISDLHLLYKNEERKPKYKQFVTASGSAYSSFVVGPSSYISHGDFTNNSFTSLNGTLLSNQVIPAIVSDNLDYIIRDTDLNDTIESAFIEEYGVSKEDALTRIYPVHITYNGEIISSLPNREYTKLTDSFLSERLSNVVSSSVIEGLEVSQISGQSHKVQVSPGNAFVKGRLFLGINPEVGTSNNRNQSSKTVTIYPENNNTVTLTTPEITAFTTGVHKVTFGTFISIDGASALSLFKETITYTGNSNVYGEGVHLGDDASIPIADLELLGVPNVSEIVKISDNTRVYERGLDWDIVFRTQIVNNLPVKRAVIGWYYKPLVFQKNTIVRRASIRPQVGTALTVLYTATVDLTLPPTLNSQLTYDTSEEFNTGFKLTTSKESTTSNILLSSWSNPNSNTINGPYLSFSQGDVSFRSSIIVYKYTGSQITKYIVYFSGNVREDGPDGSLGYQLLGNASDLGETAALTALQENNKLPLALVTVPINSANDIKQYRFRLTNVVEQQQINDQISDLLKILPALITQNILSGDVSNTITYANSAELAAEPTRVDTLTWVVDGNAFPALEDYKVEVKYSYFGDSLTTTYTAQGFVDTPQEYVDAGLLRGMVVTIKDNADNIRKKLLIVISYTATAFQNNPQISDIETHVL